MGGVRERMMRRILGVGFWELGRDVGLGWITLHYNGE